MVLKKVNGKKLHLDKVDIYHNLLKEECYATPIQPYHGIACCSWYPNLSMSLQTKLLTTQKIRAIPGKTNSEK